jgi:hypothetical protein
MKFIKIMIILIGIFFIGFQQVALAKKDHVPGKPFAFLFNLIKQFDNNKSTPGPQGPPGPEGPVGPEGSAGILEKYMKVIEVSPYDTPGPFIVYCNNIPDDVAISGNAYTYWDTSGGFPVITYNDVLRPVCTYYGEDDPEPGLKTMTCQPGELPIGWQLIQHPYNNKPYAHVVLNVICIYAPDTQ